MSTTSGEVFEELVVQLKVQPDETDLPEAHPTEAIVIDSLLETEVGPLGLWQWFLVILGIFSTTAASNFPVFTDTEPLKRCKLDEATEALLHGANLNFTEIGLITGGWTEPRGETSVLGGCRVYKAWSDHLKATFEGKSTANLSRNTIPCSERGYVYKYLPFQYPGGMVAEFNLVCEKVWFIPTGTSIFLVGMVFGYTLGGFWGAQFGLKNALICFSLIELVAFAACSAANSFWLFTILRFFVSIGGYGKLSSFNLIILDTTTPKYRSIVNGIYLLGFSVTSRAFLTLFAWLLKNWRWLNLAAASHCLLVFSYFFVIPDSPRWLLTQKRSVDAIRVLKTARKVNHWLKRDKPSGSDKLDKLLKQEIRRPSIQIIRKEDLDRVIHRIVAPKTDSACPLVTKIISTRALLRSTLLSITLFAKFSFIFIGCLLYTRRIHETIYLVSLYVALAGIPGVAIALLAYGLMKYRRLPLCMTYLTVSSVLLVGGVYTYVAGPEHDTVLTAASVIAIMLMVTAQCMMFIYIPELYPPAIRAQGFGTAAGLGRLGSVASTFVNYLDNEQKHGLPVIIYGIAAFIAAALTLTLEDTTGAELKANKEDCDKLSEDRERTRNENGRVETTYDSEN